MDKFDAPSTMETTPERLAAWEGGDGIVSSETKSLCELAYRVELASDMEDRLRI